MELLKQIIAIAEAKNDGICIGAKVQPKAHKDGEPFEVVKIVSDDTVVVKDEHGNKKEMLISDLVLAEAVDVSASVDAWKKEVKAKFQHATFSKAGKMMVAMQSDLDTKTNQVCEYQVGVFEDGKGQVFNKPKKIRTI